MLIDDIQDEDKKNILENSTLNKIQFNAILQFISSLLGLGLILFSIYTDQFQLKNEEFLFIIVISSPVILLLIGSVLLFKTVTYFRNDKDKIRKALQFKLAFWVSIFLSILLSVVLLFTLALHLF